MMCLGVGLFGFSLIGTLYTSLNCVSFSFTRLGKFSATISSAVFSTPCSLSPPSGTSIMQMLLCLILSPRSLRCFKINFSLCCCVRVFSVIFSSKLLIQSSAPPKLLLIPSSVHFLSDIIFFISDWLFFWWFNVSLILFILPLNSLRTLSTIVLNSVSGVLLASI